MQVPCAESQVSPHEHATGVDQARQPFAAAAQVWTCAPEHCVAPAEEQLLVHEGLLLLLHAEPAPSSSTMATSWPAFVIDPPPEFNRP